MPNSNFTPKIANIFHEGSYGRFWVARICATVSFQMAGVAIGWKVYAITHSTFALGIVGLVQFLPMLLLILVVGHVADRFNRKTILSICQTVECFAMVAIGLASVTGHLNPNGIYIAVTVIGSARAFEAPSTQALVPTLVEDFRVPKAIAWTASATQTASIIGPALGGVLYAFGAHVPFFTCAALYGIAALLSSTLHPRRKSSPLPNTNASSIFSGVHYIWNHKSIFGAISLDLFAVLLGGATALLPAYARDILKIGPWGLGLLRLAPAVGALANSIVLARFPIRHYAGRRMFLAVSIFGAATVGFAVSRNLALSLACLCILGAADVTSVVVRSSLVQLETPDEMRGRVSAVNSLFIGTSNQLGQFESGVTAAWFGLVPATALGGIGSIVVALVWMALFPGLRRLDTLSVLRPSAPLETGTEAGDTA